MRDPRERLRDILDAISAIERYPCGDLAAFAGNELLQVWFLHNLQIIGIRNVLVHGYFDIDTDIVRRAVTQDIPVLQPAVLRLLAAVAGRG